MARILLITTKQPSSNPRMRKSADALAQSDHTVHVLYAYNADWADKADIPILQSAKWTYERIGGHPKEKKTTYFIGRLLRKAHELLDNPKKALCRGYDDYIQIGIRWKPDLVIGHNPGALGPLDKISRRLNIPALFDAEDFHRGETNPDSRAAKTVQKLEDEVLPRLKTITAASPLIAQEYAKLYPNLSTVIINNAFQLSQLQPEPSSRNGALSLVWFSQVLGLDRGLIEFLGSLRHLIDVPLRFHLIGLANATTQSTIEEYFNSVHHELQFHQPLPEKQLFRLLSTCDIGLALEPGFSENNQKARSNKIYSYPIAGCYTLLSQTIGQRKFVEEHPMAGELIDLSNPLQIAGKIRFYHDNRSVLLLRRQDAWKLAKTRLNWENESKHLVSIVTEMLKP